MLVTIKLFVTSMIVFNESPTTGTAKANLKQANNLYLRTKVFDGNWSNIIRIVNYKGTN